MKLEEPCNRGSLNNTHQAHSFLEEMTGVPTDQRFTNCEDSRHHVDQCALIAEPCVGKSRCTEFGNFLMELWPKRDALGSRLAASQRAVDICALVWSSDVSSTVL